MHFVIWKTNVLDSPASLQQLKDLKIHVIVCLWFDLKWKTTLICAESVEVERDTTLSDIKREISQLHYHVLVWVNSPEDWLCLVLTLIWLRILDS